MEAIVDKELAAVIARMVEAEVEQRIAAMQSRQNSRTASGKAHAKLRGRMQEMDVDGKYLGRKWGLSSGPISQRMCGRQPWTVWEMYDLMNMLDIPAEQMHEYFPDYREQKGGKNHG